MTLPCSRLSRRRLLGGLAAGTLALASPARAADKISVGVLRFVSSGPLFLAVERGYFGEQGLDVTYTMLRGMFLPGKVAPDVTAFYVDLFKKLTQTAEYKDYMEKQALKPVFMTGKEMTDFLQKDEELHKQLMTEAGFVATTN